MKKTVMLLILLVATTAFAVPVYTGKAMYGSTQSNNSTVTSTIVTGKQGSFMAIAKANNNRRPVISAPSRLNPSRNVLHSTATAQTWDYQGYCLDKNQTVQLKATRLLCNYSRQDRQWNNWSCATPGYLRCVGTACPRATCRTQGTRVN